ncbi:MAG TPA: TCR/Tet family MFS transporter [Xanthobacteraceae bacterium]|nr:TCR/Tet family MFS transporter [Xanthobacteraceae bacterium]
MSAAEASPPAARPALVFIFITLVLDMLSIGIIIPALPKLVEDFMGGDTARAAEIFGVFGTVWALMQFLFTPVHGALSDRFGRRPIILISNFGLGVDYIVMALAPSLWWLLLGRTISGVCAASIGAAFAYIADVTPPAERAARFGVLGGAIGIGFVLGPALGGVLATFDPHLPFWAAAVLSICNGLYGLLILPESLPADRRSPFSWRRANPVGSLHLLRSDRELSGLAVVNFIASLGFVVLPSTFVLYTGYRFGWDTGTVGISLGAYGVCLMAVQVGLVRFLVPRIGERNMLLLGFVLGAGGLALMGLANTPFLAWASIAIAPFSGLTGPAIQALMTSRVSPNQQGQLQGANGSVVGIAQLIGPTIFAGTFAYFIGAGRDWQLPGAAYLLAAVLYLAAGALAWRITSRKSQAGG